MVRKLLFLSLFLIGLVGVSSNLFGQNPVYACDIRNHDLVSPTEFEFDLFISNSGSVDFELANYQAGIQVAPSFVNGGTISAALVSGSSELTVDQQPSAISFDQATSCIMLAPAAPPRELLGGGVSATSGTLIAENNGTRVCRVRLTNTAAFGSEAMAPDWNFSVEPYNTVVSAFVGPADQKVNTIITESANHSRAIAMKAYLEGAYDADADAMNATLHDVLPLVQPFNVEPWNYTGTESVSEIPANAVDWVLVELRDATEASLADASTTRSKRPCFITDQGQIISLDGLSSVELNFVPENLIFPVIRHRNHLDVIGSGSLQNIAGVMTYDFSTSIDQAFNSGAGYKQIDVSPEVYGLVAGDADVDGEIGVNDFTLWAVDFGNAPVYFNSDMDMDGDIGVNDFTRWAVNFGIANPVEGIVPAKLYKSQIRENK
ncbi:MAG: hypothetical protein PHQ65_05855 [Bacteroidales bacterium]|nr:hypothetical protein [Bacteroidales bacterium]MDD3664768.1 hypothetical protein [Bacteroidales bacterium]